MASRHMFRRLATVLASRAQHHIRHQTISKCAHTQSGALSHLPSARLMSTAAKFECINIQDEQDFQKQVMENKTPVVVDFHATWCGPCKLLGPRLESIIAGKAGKVILAKVDIDDNSDLAIRFGVSSVPTVVSIKDGQPQGKFIGLQEDDIIDSFVERLIN